MFPALKTLTPSQIAHLSERIHNKLVVAELLQLKNRSAHQNIQIIANASAQAAKYYSEMKRDVERKTEEKIRKAMETIEQAECEFKWAMLDIESDNSILVFVHAIMDTTKKNS